jgi:enoyl-CoA hydratase
MTKVPRTTPAVTGPWTAFAVRMDGPVAVVTLLGPGRGNVLGPEFFTELPVLFAALDEACEVRSIVLHGSEGHFSYGLDLGRMAPLFDELLSADSAAARMRFLHEIRRLQDAITAVAACRTPVVTSLSGWCIGGGLDLAAATDVRVAARTARFSIREAKMAIVADIGSLQRLTGVIGEGHLRQLALTGEDFNADHALRIGLVNDLFETEAAAFEGALTIAREIAANSPLVTLGIKEVLNAERASRVAEGLRYVGTWNAAFLGSRDLAEALAAFTDRRTPVFTGE